MARIRTIKPEFWADEKIASLPLGGRLLFIGSWNNADDFGVIRGSAKLLKSQVFPYDEDVRLGTVQEWIDALVKARMLVPFSVRGESYFYVRTWLDHQKVDKPSQKARLISASDLKSALPDVFNTLPEGNPNPTRVLPEGSPSPTRVLPVGMEEEEEEEGNMKRNGSATPSSEILSSPPIVSTGKETAFDEGAVSKALDHARCLSVEERLIVASWFECGCTIEDIREAYLEKNNNRVKFLANIVPEFKSKRLKRSTNRRDDAIDKWAAKEEAA